MAEVRVTVAVARVLREFLTDPSKPRYGYELMQLTGYPSGKLYPLLARLHSAGWLIREREDADPAHVGRPTRWLYRLSPEGAKFARQELAVLAEQLGSVALPLEPVAPQRLPLPLPLRSQGGVA